jgi:hypothetical protein
MGISIGVGRVYGATGSERTSVGPDITTVFFISQQQRSLRTHPMRLGIDNDLVGRVDGRYPRVSLTDAFAGRHLRALIIPRRVRWLDVAHVLLPMAREHRTRRPISPCRSQNLYSRAFPTAS